MTRLETPFEFHSTTSDVLQGVDLSGKTALVTGANAAIGRGTHRLPGIPDQWPVFAVGDQHSG